MVKARAAESFMNVDFCACFLLYHLILFSFFLGNAISSHSAFICWLQPFGLLMEMPYTTIRVQAIYLLEAGVAMTNKQKLGIW